MSRAVDIIKVSEGLRLKAYRDGGGTWTIGWGHTKGVVYGLTITEEQAEEFLRVDMAWVLTLIATTVKVALNENQHAAVASLIFNIGSSQWRTSTALRRLNAGNYAGAAEAMTWFKKIRVNGVLEVDNGLMNRRERERVLFLSGTPVAAPVQVARGDVYGGEAKLMRHSKTEWLGLSGVLTTVLTAWGQLTRDAPDIIAQIAPYGPILLGVIFLAVMFNRYMDSRKGIH